MQMPEDLEQFHYADRPDMNVFIVGDPGDRLLHDRGSTFVHGYFTTPELARSLQAAHQELEEAKKRSNVEDERDLPAWDDYMDAFMAVTAERRTVRTDRGHNDDSVDIPTGWLFENLEIDEHERIVPGQLITAERLAISGAHKFLPARKVK